MCKIILKLRGSRGSNYSNHMSGLSLMFFLDKGRQLQIFFLRMTRSSSAITSPVRTISPPLPPENNTVNISEINVSDLSLPAPEESYPPLSPDRMDDEYPPPPPPPLSSDISLTNGSTPRRDQRSSASALNSNISTLSDTKTEDSGDDNKRRTKVSKVRTVILTFSYFVNFCLLTTQSYICYSQLR